MTFIYIFIIYLKNCSTNFMKRYLNNRVIYCIVYIYGRVRIVPVLIMVYKVVTIVVLSNYI